MTVYSFFIYIAIGMFAGIVSEMFGIGGGLVIIPAPVYIAGYSQIAAKVPAWRYSCRQSSLLQPWSITGAGGGPRRL